MASHTQLTPRFINAFPSTSKTSTCFSQVATYFDRRFAEFFEEAVTRDLSAVDAVEPFGGSGSTHSSTIPSFGEVDHGSSFPTSSGNLALSANSSTLSPTVERKTSVISSTGVQQKLQNLHLNIWKGFLFPFCGFRFAWRLALTFIRYCEVRVRWACARVERLVTRIQTTLQGSEDDIGWLRYMAGSAPVEDRTDRFIQLLGLVSNGVHKLPSCLVYLLVPGLFSNHGPLYFVDTKKYFSRLGLTCHIAKIHSEAAVETNAMELKNYIEELYWGSGKRVLLLGHSKGGVDAAAAIAMYWPDLKDKVSGLVLVQSPYGGSPIASDILREGQIADLETRHIMELLICKVIKGDMRSLEDLTYDKRREFLAKYPLPPGFPTVSFHTEVSIAPGVLSTMSHIAHAELPWLPVCSPGSTSEEPTAATTLPVIVPLAASMAVCALHLELRYGEKSDGLVVRKDAEVPGSVVVKPDRKLDHAWMVYSPARKEAKEPDSSEMCEALLTLLLEINQEKRLSWMKKFD